jgi:hypothetical protein
MKLVSLKKLELWDVIAVLLFHCEDLRSMRRYWVDIIFTKYFYTLESHEEMFSELMLDSPSSLLDILNLDQ